MKYFYPLFLSFSLIIFSATLIGCSDDSDSSNGSDDNEQDSTAPIIPPITLPATQHNLAIEIVGGGSVASDPAGIDCATDCNENYDSTISVTLTSAADNGFAFNSWLGGCTGTGACAVSMSEDQTVTAEFISTAAAMHPLTVTVTGSGQVTSIPAGILCETDCTENYVENTLVSLHTIPAVGFILDHWSGDCSGNGACNVTLTAAKMVSAVFTVISSPTVLIENYSASGAAVTLADIPRDASGITWHPGINQYLIIRNNAAIIYRYDNVFQYLGQININGIGRDTEGISYVEGNDVLLVAEDNYATKVTIDESVTSIAGNIPNAQRYRILAPSVGNKGLEGIASRKISAAFPQIRVYACQEGTMSASGSNADKRVVYFDMPNPDPLTLLSYADASLIVHEPWNAESVLDGKAGDLAGMVYDSRTNHLILLSERSSRAIQVDPATGAIISELDISGAAQFEGVTLGPNGELVFVSEPNLIRIYTQ